MPEMEASVTSYVATVIGEDKFADLEIEHEADLSNVIRQRLDRFAVEELDNHKEDLERVASINVHHGAAIGGILEWADKVDADLVVMGSHGKGFLQHALLGSVAEKVLRKTRRPVLIVPLPQG
jgi:nucleotide-binding universal stress UspA family protein